MPLRRTNVTVDFWSIRKVAAIKFLQLRIYLTSEDALVSETLKRNPETTKTSKEVNKPHLDGAPFETELLYDWPRSIVISEANTGMKGTDLVLMRSTRSDVKEQTSLVW